MTFDKNLRISLQNPLVAEEAGCEDSPSEGSFQGRVSLKRQETSSVVLPLAASPLLQVLWSCSAQEKLDQWIIKQESYNF